jgi:hypothetical protein
MAADRLVEGLRDGEQDFLVYPIVFLYRHYIELELKELIRDGSRLLNKPRNRPAGHHLEKLWPQCRKILQEAFPEEPHADFDAMGELLIQFAQVDPTSTGFRYPEDTQGKPSLPGVTHIDLANLSEVVRKMAGFFDGAGAKVSEYLSIQEDMLDDAW